MFLVSNDVAIAMESITKRYPSIMLGSHYRFLSIDSESHRRKERSLIDTSLQ